LAPSPAEKFRVSLTLIKNGSLSWLLSFGFVPDPSGPPSFGDRKRSPATADSCTAANRHVRKLVSTVRRAFPHHDEMPKDTGTISVSSVEDSITNVAALGSGPAASHRGLAVLRLGPARFGPLYMPRSTWAALP
jgi:hypothetical protein